MKRLIAPAALIVVLALAGCSGPGEDTAAAPRTAPSASTASFTELVEGAKFPKTYEAGVEAIEALWWWVDSECTAASKDQVDMMNRSYGNDQDILKAGNGETDAADLLKLDYAKAVENVCS